MTSPTGLSPSMAGLSSPIWLSFAAACAVRTPMCSHMGLGSSDFARRYSRNRCFFLFLRLLRCFSSPGSPPYTMDSCMDTWSLSMWVSPFRNPRLSGYLLLPAAFRSLSRLSSALSAKASSLRPFLLDHSFPYSVMGLVSWVFLWFLLVVSLPSSLDDGLGCLILYMGSCIPLSISCSSVSFFPYMIS